jgi:hypothetical protein
MRDFSQYVHQRGGVSGDVLGAMNGLGTHTDNVVLQLFNHPHHEGTAGMVHDLVVISNLEATADDIENIRRGNPPPKVMDSELWDRMLLSAGVRSLRSICIHEGWRRNAYLMWGEWGVCPATVCGEVCFPEGFFHGDYDTVIAHRSSPRLARLSPITIASWVGEKTKRGAASKKKRRKQKASKGATKLAKYEESLVEESKKALNKYSVSM